MKLVRWLRALMARPVSRILLGSLIGQGSILAVSPLLTRLYSPSDFGVFAVVTAICAVLGGVATLSWDRAIVVPRSDQTARSIVAVGLLTVLGISAILTLVSLLLRDGISALFDAPSLSLYWWIVPLTVLFIGLYALVSGWTVRREHYNALGVRNGVMGVSQAASSVALGVAGAAPFGLLISLFVGRTAALSSMFREIASIKAHRVSWRRLQVTTLRYRRFPLVSTWSRLLNSLGLQLPIILIIALYGDLVGGLFALTLRVLAAPVSIVVDATSQYFEGTFGRRNRERNGGLAESVRAFSSRMAIVALVPTILVSFAGSWLFGVVFGAGWTDAGLYAQITVWTYFAQFVVTPVSRALLILEKQGLQLTWDVSRFALTSTVIIGSSLVGASFFMCIALLSVAQIVTYGALWVMCHAAARSRDREVA